MSDNAKSYDESQQNAFSNPALISLVRFSSRNTPNTLSLRDVLLSNVKAQLQCNLPNAYNLWKKMYFRACLCVCFSQNIFI